MCGLSRIKQATFKYDGCLIGNGKTLLQSMFSVSFNYILNKDHHVPLNLVHFQATAELHSFDLRSEFASNGVRAEHLDEATQNTMIL